MNRRDSHEQFLRNRVEAACDRAFRRGRRGHDGWFRIESRDRQNIEKVIEEIQEKRKVLWKKQPSEDTQEQLISQLTDRLGLCRYRMEEESLRLDAFRRSYHDCLQTLKEGKGTADLYESSLVRGEDGIQRMRYDWSFVDNQKPVAELERQIKELTKKYQELIKANGKQTPEAAELIKRAANLRRNIDELSNKLMRRFLVLQDNINNTGSRVEEYQNQMTALTAKIEKARIRRDKELSSKQREDQRLAVWEQRLSRLLVVPPQVVPSQATPPCDPRVIGYLREGSRLLLAP